ncbi:MAG TPA: SRPBCC family protein [Actinomycetota bacterium]|nr:SRPBCC family protein [Actinomycetota bacterium]
MSLIRVAETVDATPQEVWEVVADPRNLPLWNRHIREVHDVPDHGLKEGSRYWTTVSALGVSVRVDAEVEEIDPPRFARVRLTGPVDAVVRTWVGPAGSGKSRLEHEVEYHLRGGPVGELLERALRTFGGQTLLRRGIRAQKRQVETG